MRVTIPFHRGGKAKTCPGAHTAVSDRPQKRVKELILGQESCDVCGKETTFGFTQAPWRSHLELSFQHSFEVRISIPMSLLGEQLREEDRCYLGPHT